MPEFNTVKVAKDAQNPRIARLQLNRPDKLNAISSSMPGDIQRAVKYLEADDEVHVIIVEGEGRAFCAGYDLNEYAEGMWFRRQAQAEGFKSAIEWRDSGRPIPQGDEARALVARLEKQLAEARAKL